MLLYFFFFNNQILLQLFFFMQCIKKEAFSVSDFNQAISPF